MFIKCNQEKKNKTVLFHFSLHLKLSVSLLRHFSDDEQFLSDYTSINKVVFNCPQQLGPSTSSVTLYTTYPRRELSEEDLVKSLADLGLAPSSTLVVALVSLDWLCFDKNLITILSLLYLLERKYINKLMQSSGLS